MTDNPFEAVLDRLREKGWGKGSFWGVGGKESGPFSGPFCIRGAATKIPGAEVYKFVEPIILNQYSDRLRPDRDTIAMFNDHPYTTFADVERVLEKAAVKWEEERVLRND